MTEPEAVPLITLQAEPRGRQADHVVLDGHTGSRPDQVIIRFHPEDAPDHTHSFAIQRDRLQALLELAPRSLEA